MTCCSVCRNLDIRARQGCCPDSPRCCRALSLRRTCKRRRHRVTNKSPSHPIPHLLLPRLPIRPDALRMAVASFCATRGWWEWDEFRMASAMGKASVCALHPKRWKGWLPDPDSSRAVCPARDRPSCREFWQRDWPVLAAGDGASVPGRCGIRFRQTRPNWLQPTGTDCTSLRESCAGQLRCCCYRWLARCEPIVAGRVTWARLRLLGPATAGTSDTFCWSSCSAGCDGAACVWPQRRCSPVHRSATRAMPHLLSKSKGNNKKRVNKLSDGNTNNPLLAEIRIP